MPSELSTACHLKWVPDSLYNSAILATASNYEAFKIDLKYLPDPVQFDVYYKLYDKGRLNELGYEFSNLDVFFCVLKATDKRLLLHRSFQAVMDHHMSISAKLSEAFKDRCLKLMTSSSSSLQSFNKDYTSNDVNGSKVCEVGVNKNSFASMEKLLILGLALGDFLTEAGWLVDSESVLSSCLTLCEYIYNKNACKIKDDCIDSTTTPNDTSTNKTITTTTTTNNNNNNNNNLNNNNNNNYNLTMLQCLVRLMHVQNSYCLYESSEKTWNRILEHLKSLENSHVRVNRSLIYSDYSDLLFARSSYEKAYEMSCTAIIDINSSLPPKVIVDVFRQSSKVCVVWRKFKEAEMLIEFAVKYANEHFGTKHPIYSDVLLDYGFYLLNVDRICQAVKIYQTALEIRIAVFGGVNLHVAIAHEDLAYCTYVHEYNTGKFQDARQHAETAICIITRIIPPDHLLLASSKRVKALILEEIAIESYPRETEMLLLEEAEELHLASLDLALKAFGENNVQTAKHYGNLGRLYQSMQKYEMAELNHLKAIEIKERLLGDEDYEVALSVGHLASLYNYDLNLFEKAEVLYLRSIAIGKKLFGDGYSGLEYDYRGLMRLYQVKEDFTRANHYTSLLRQWAIIREQLYDDDNNNNNNNNDNHNNNYNNNNNYDNNYVGNNNNNNIRNRSGSYYYNIRPNNNNNNNNNKLNNKTNNNNNNNYNNNGNHDNDNNNNVVYQFIGKLSSSPSFSSTIQKIKNAHRRDVIVAMDTGDGNEDSGNDGGGSSSSSGGCGSSSSGCCSDGGGDDDEGVGCVMGLSTSSSSSSVA